MRVIFPSWVGETRSEERMNRRPNGQESEALRLVKARGPWLTSGLSDAADGNLASDPP